jgi:hypothetical protein
LLNEENKLDDDDLKEMRRIRLLDIKLWSILNELGIYSLFLLILYVVSFFNLNNSSFLYNQLFLSSFVNQKSPNEIGLHDVNIDFLKNYKLITILFICIQIIIKIQKIEDFWSWTIDKLATGLRANTWYNDKPPYGLAGFINDFSSRMIGYATLRQLRVKNGKKINMT